MSQAVMKFKTVRHPKSEELESLYFVKAQLERMVNIENDPVRGMLLKALHETKHQIMNINNGY